MTLTQTYSLDNLANLVNNYYAANIPNLNAGDNAKIGELLAIFRFDSDRDYMREHFEKTNPENPSDIFDYYRKKCRKHTALCEAFHYYLLTPRKLRAVAFLEAVKPVNPHRKLLNSIAITSTNDELKELNDDIVEATGKTINELLKKNPLIIKQLRVYGSLFSGTRKTDIIRDRSVITKMIFNIVDRQTLINLMCYESYQTIRNVHNVLSERREGGIMMLIDAFSKGNMRWTLIHVLNRALNGSQEYLVSRLTKLDGKRAYTREYDFLLSLLLAEPIYDTANLKGVKVPRKNPLTVINEILEYSVDEYILEMRSLFYHSLIRHSYNDHSLEMLV